MSKLGDFTIFALSLKNVNVSNKRIVKDKFIMVVVAGLSTVPVIVCLFWNIFYPFDVAIKLDVQYDNGESVKITIEKLCGSRWGI